MKTNYEDIIPGYLRYSTNTELAEWRLGHVPFLMALGPVEGWAILDLGCGSANFSLVLSEQGAQIVGLDQKPKVIEEARKRDPRGDYRVNHGLIAKELAGMEFEAIIATFSVCAIPDSELRYILRDMRTLLKPGGKLLILEPNLEKALGIQYASLHYHHKEGVQSGDEVLVTLGTKGEELPPVTDIYRTHADYRQLLEEAGFVIDQMEEPVPDPTWEGDWDLERQYPPFLLIAAH